MDINEVKNIDNDELVVDATNDAPLPQDAMTNTKADADEEDGDDNNVGAEDGNNNNEVEDTKGREEGGAIRWSKTGMMMMTKRT